MLGAPKDVLDERSVPGRAIVEGLETQLAVLGGTTNVAEQSRALEALADRLRAAGAEVARDRLAPDELQRRRAAGSRAASPSSDWPTTRSGPIGFEPVGTFAVTGPPQSGKTNAMRALIDAMRRFDPEVRLFHFGGPPAQLGDHARGCAAPRRSTR